jgi:hypothetical protein
MGVGGQRHAPAALLPGMTPVPIAQEAAPGPVWTGAENLASTGIRFPDLPARSVIAIPTKLSRPTFCIQSVRKVTVQLVLPQWLCSNVRSSKTGRMWWCSTTDGSTDSMQVVSKTPPVYCMRLLFVCGSIDSVCCVAYWKMSKLMLVSLCLIRCHRQGKQLFSASLKDLELCLASGFM